MTAEEIRKLEINTKGLRDEVQVHVELQKYKMLREIAAQLAEINVTLKSKPAPSEKEKL